MTYHEIDPDGPGGGDESILLIILAGMAADRNFDFSVN